MIPLPHRPSDQIMWNSTLTSTFLRLIWVDRIFLRCRYEVRTYLLLNVGNTWSLNVFINSANAYFSHNLHGWKIKNCLIYWSAFVLFENYKDSYTWYWFVYVMFCMWFLTHSTNTKSHSMLRVRYQHWIRMGTTFQALSFENKICAVQRGVGFNVIHSFKKKVVSSNSHDSSKQQIL